MTVQDLLIQAYAKSKKTQPNQIATEATELLTVANRVIRTFVQIGVRVNATFFGGQEVVVEDPEDGGWPRPTSAEAIYLVQTAAGDDVVVAPFDDVEADNVHPTVYPLGQVYWPAGLDNDPSGDLTFYYARRPDDAATIADEIDTIWPEAYAELAALEIAAYLANKDQRVDELGFLVAERDRWLIMYLAFLEHETMNMSRRFRVEMQTSNVVPVGSLLTGGSSVDV